MNRYAPRPRADRLAAQADLPPAPVVHVRKPMTDAEIMALVEEVRLGVEDAKGDNPDVGEDDITYEIAMSMTAGLPRKEAVMVQRMCGIYL